jgi:hypothetical protein
VYPLFPDLPAQRNAVPNKAQMRALMLRNLQRVYEREVTVRCACGHRAFFLATTLCWACACGRCGAYARGEFTPEETLALEEED